MASLNNIGGLHYEMMRRCYNENSVAYKDYGAKGISVCSEWHDRENFRKWCMENGYKKGLRLERIDTSKNYEPSNCKFGMRFKLTTGAGRYSKETKNRRKELFEFYGIPPKYSKTRIYRIFNGMHSRCENKNHDNYGNYGGSGIKICDEWCGEIGFFRFYKWATENGYNDDLSIDRIDNTKGYAPSNCRWATYKEQAKNRRCSISVIYNQKEMSLKEVAILENLDYGMLYSRVKLKGMTIDEALMDIKNSKR